MKVTPYKNSSLSKKNQVAGMFNNIAWRYDFLNHFLSFGVDHYWRTRTISFLKKDNPKIILDVATGTGDLAIASLRLSPEKIFGIDISTDMLSIGRNKIKKKNFENKIELLEGDSENLIFEDNKFDAITVGFGVRNFEHLEKGLSEMLRVLKPNGKAAILEFSKPENKFFRVLYNFYSRTICPAFGKIISKDAAAYDYLHKSVEAFPSGKEFVSILEQSGFRNVIFKPLTFGVVTVYIAQK